MKIVKDKGFYKIYYYCSKCGLLIAKETDNSSINIKKSILKSNKFPKYCPDCGNLLFNDL